MVHHPENQMLFTELKNLYSFSRYFDLKFRKYNGLYGESKLMRVMKFHVFLNNLLLKHARELIFALQIIHRMAKKSY